ncbi:MAG TPA: LacI family DNA-binding transcriptional regulator [Acidimicrobiia bacterium]|nr:LacI family DNA-binding transcriptional regulator [Acidimicrobiia bacterium]
MTDRTRPNGGVTLLDVAREAGVHPSTVSRALDPRQQDRVKEPTRARIVDVANRLGYRPHLVARGLQSGRTATVGVIAADLGNTFVTPIIHGVTSAIEAVGLLPLIAETQDDHERLAVILDHMLSRRVDAIVVAAARAGDKDILESAGRVVPVIIAARPLDDSLLPQVIHDDERGARLAAEHFYDLGHRLVAQLRGPADVANFSRRAVGFSDFCEAMGMDEVEIPERGHTPSIEEGERLARALIDRGGPLPTAIFAHNDLMAIGALSVLRTAGLRVPGIVSLVGYNDLPMVGQIDPPLTTVLYPSLEVGTMAGEMVSQLLSGKRPSDHTLEPVLVVRASTRPV